jgi:hypothetical protein
MKEEYEQFKEQHRQMFDMLSSQEKQELEAFEKTLLESLVKVLRTVEQRVKPEAPKTSIEVTL